MLVVAPGRWLLKGGFALDLRLADRARTTKDVDIEWQADEEDLSEALIDAVSSDVGDFFAFAIERSGTPEDRLGGSHRFRVSASLAGRPFETFLLDVGFRGGSEIAAETLRTEDLLAFAEIAPVEVEAISLELQVAEKLHAYTRTYEGGRPSTRTKDASAAFPPQLRATWVRASPGLPRTRPPSGAARGATNRSRRRP